MYKKLVYFIFLIFLISELPVYCCDPMIPLGIAIGGANAILVSVYGLLLAVAIKCIFFPFLTKNLSWFKAIVFMFIANIVSTVIGLFFAVIAISPMVGFVFIPVIYLLAKPPSKRLELSNWQPFTKINRTIFPILMTILWFGSYWIFLFAQLSHEDFHSPVGYWIFKILAIYVGLLINFGLTTLWEEWVISILSKNKSVSYLKAVAITNLITLFVVSVVGAIIIIPQRLGIPGFLIN